MGPVPGTGLFSNFLTTFRERPCVWWNVSFWSQQAGFRSWLHGCGAPQGVLGFSGPQCIARQMEGVGEWRAHSKCSLKGSVPAPLEQPIPWQMKKRRL